MDLQYCMESGIPFMRREGGRGELFYGLHKVKRGLIRTAEEISEGRIEKATLSGDFTFYPKEDLHGLENSLGKVPWEDNQIIARMEKFNKERGVESPGEDSKDIDLAGLVSDFVCLPQAGASNLEIIFN